jgi:predicted RNase H-like HicB family nuclease
VAQIVVNALVHEEEDGSYWAEVQELPGCFASGSTLDELREALLDAIQLWMPDGVTLGEPAFELEEMEAPDGADEGPGCPRRLRVCA